MPQWFINDLSLRSQYATADAFWADLETLLIAREAIPAARSDLRCSKSFGYLPVSGPTTVREAIHVRDADRRFLALRWITKGPFWEADRQPLDPDIFYYADTDVTDQGLGEAARRRLIGLDARTVSFPGIAQFESSPLTVLHLQADETLTEIGVPNIWNVSLLRDAALWEAQKLSRWETLIQDAHNKFDHLTIASEEILVRLQPYPYDEGVAARIIQLLGVLQKIAVAREQHGDGSTAVTALMRVYFIGKEAQFSDEFNVNKKKFKNEMTFTDPEDASKNLFCSWHGKIRTPLPYRIHFQWPVPKGQRHLKVLYIGPKLTRT